ncbi:MAG: glycosyltransferase [Nitrospira sp.]|nr:glycosyltransferase [Nitrospira sp.]
MTQLVRLHGFEWSVVLFNEGRLADELRKLPVSLTVISETSHGPVGIAFRLAKIFRAIRPDIVHTHKYKDSIVASIVARCMGVRRIIRVVHGRPEPFNGLRNARMVGYTMLDRLVTHLLIDKVVAVSSDLEQLLIGTFGRNRVVCIHNGINLGSIVVTMSRVDKRKEWQVSDKTILIGTVGRLVPVKGHMVLLEALKILRELHGNVKLLLVGDGPLRTNLETEAKRLGLEHFVIFSGHQEQPHDLINMMDIFLLPSLHEGIPMVLLEALALNRPVIASRVGGIPEVLSHGRSGILVSPAKPGALAMAIRDLIEHPDKAVSIGMAGRVQVETEFSASIMADRTVGVYNSLLGN